MVWQWLTLALWAVWLIFYWRGGGKILTDMQAATSTPDRLYLLILTGATVGLVVSGGVLTLQGEPPAPLTPVGAVLVAVGVAGTFYCRHTLGRYWTAQTALQADHQVVDRGPYGVVRHPIYTFALALYVGNGLAFPTGFTALPVAISLVGYFLKTAHEDRFLASSLPGYAAYQERVRCRLVPGVW
ncbi:MAG: isoprenylcysteine carboxylmethyltransferase family protein [Chloroflexi bacterium]|nr:isoprenylcysteine carboxylmethyltransferase family protein [Chloroflexota bacterium]